MSKNNRFLKGDTHSIIAPVHSYHDVEAGDLMLLNNTNGYEGVNTTADNYAFPFDYCKFASASMGTGMAEAVHSAFLGVAMESSPSGVTENITIATAGIFRYPVHTARVGGAVTIGSTVHAVSNSLDAGVSPQSVSFGSSSADTISSTAILGFIVKTDSGVSFVDIQIRTAFGPSGKITGQP